MQSMKPVFISALCLLLAACDEDPARSVKVIARPIAAAPAEATFAPHNQPANPSQSLSAEAPAPRPASQNLAASPRANPLAEFCPPPKEDPPGPSKFVIDGACPFRHSAPVACEALQDDFIVAATRKAKNGATVVIYLNVEQYHGPGTYDGAQMFLALQGGTTIYRWSSETVHVVVGPKEAFVTLPETRLEIEPVRVECSRLIGPESNYQFQCEGVRDTNPALERSVEIVSGDLQCEPGAKP